MFRPTPQKMAGLCYVTPVTGHKAYTGKEEEDDFHFLLTPAFLYTSVINSHF
jgi:hypothetical protein